LYNANVEMLYSLNNGKQIYWPGRLINEFRITLVDNCTRLCD